MTLTTYRDILKNLAELEVIHQTTLLLKQTDEAQNSFVLERIYPTNPSLTYPLTSALTLDGVNIYLDRYLELTRESRKVETPASDNTLTKEPHPTTSLTLGELIAILAKCGPDRLVIFDRDISSYPRPGRDTKVHLATVDAIEFTQSNVKRTVSQFKLDLDDILTSGLMCSTGVRRGLYNHSPLWLEVVAGKFGVPITGVTSFDEYVSINTTQNLSM